jgi:REP-associated tyrosine transposase
MTAPRRHIHAAGTFFVTSRTWQSRQLFVNEEIWEMFLGSLLRYRDQGHYALHAFVLMPEHFHALITPAENVALERAVQLIKGGSAHTIGKAQNMAFPVWQRGFSDHRIRNFDDYRAHVDYIEQNPVKRGLVTMPSEYRWCSAGCAVKLDDVPQRLKPLSRVMVVRHG